LNNVYPSTGATVAVFDKAGNARIDGNVYRDDKLVVTSSDGLVTNTYYFSMLSYSVVKYLAYVISDEYVVDQVKYTIKSPTSSTSLADFAAKLYPAPGATVKVLDKNGNVSTATNLKVGDKLLVTAADGLTTATYGIWVDGTKVIDPLAQAIKVYPNPTSDGRVIVQGLAKGNRVQVFNAAGMSLRDVIVENSTDYVSLAAQPAGIYIFVISNGDQHINIQKIVKR
jgi:lipoprotein-anchoring transpeptidase ErfK/SrfK